MDAKLYWSAELSEIAVLVFDAAVECPYCHGKATVHCAVCPQVFKIAEALTQLAKTAQAMAIADEPLTVGDQCNS